MLSDSQIYDLCMAGMVEPFDPDLVNPHSLDIRLGHDLQAERAVDSIYDELDRWKHRKWCATRLADNKALTLAPGYFMLGGSLEYIRLPRDIGAMFHLKSSRAREGYGHSLAGLCDAGWHGHLTLELSNHSRTPLPLYPGLRIGQLTFHRLEQPPKHDYSSTGRYNGDPGAQPSKG